MGNFVILAVVGVIIVFAVRSVIKRGKNGCCGGGECSVDSVKVSDKVEGHYPFKAMIFVDDMHCGNCKKKVEKCLKCHCRCLGYGGFKQSYSGSADEGRAQRGRA